MSLTFDGKPGIFTSRADSDSKAAIAREIPGQPSDLSLQGRPALQIAAGRLPVIPTLSHQDNLDAPSGEKGFDVSVEAAEARVWKSEGILEEEHSRVGPSTALEVDSTSAGGAQKSTASHPEFQVPGTPSSVSKARSKRRGDTLDEGCAIESDPVSKRPRLHLQPRTKHFLDGFPYSSSVLQGFEPPSPLFFSNTDRARPTLPARFSSSEAAAKMLSKTRSEDSHVKTVSLARGVLTAPVTSDNSSPQRTVVGRNGMNRSASARSISPDSASSVKDLDGVLNSIGIVELLEQDERPTFIIDLGDKDNYGPGPLQLIFSNLALRSSDGLDALVAGTSREDMSPGPQTFLQFKSWLISAATNGESLSVCLPSFLYANMSWSCSTVRKRLRVISGAFLTISGDPKPNPPQSDTSTILPVRRSTEENRTAHAVPHQPFDYFGAVLSASNIAATSHPPNRHIVSAEDTVPTIEAHSPAHVRSGSGDEVIMAEICGMTTSPDANISAATELLPSDAHTYLPFNAIEPTFQPGSSQRPASAVSDSTSSQIPVIPSDAPSFDWTRLPVTDNMPEHIRFARSIDWASTPLGPIESWSTDLRLMCNLIMASPHPAAFYWGPEEIAIYNEAYVMLAGQKHPSLMGQSYRTAWKEIWDDVKDVFASARLTGQATMKDDDCLFIMRNNYLEETYFSWSIIPMVGSDGLVRGLYNPAFEKTRRKIAERRMLTLREVGERTATARDVKGFWETVLASFEFNELDSPFLLLYSVADELDSDASSIHSSSVVSTRQCTLEGALGVPEGHPAAAENIELRNGNEGFGSALRDAIKTDKPVLLEVGSPDLPEHLVKGLQWRGFGDPVRAVVVCPIHPTTGTTSENVLGFLILGVNPRRPYDDDYSLFVQLLSRQLATSLASVVLFEEEIRRGQKAAKLAALDRIELSEQLAQRTQEAIESETRFTRMAEFAPVGMFIADKDGKITFANESWWNLSGVHRDGFTPDKWMEAVKDEDQELVKQMWETLVVRTESVSGEFRFKAQWEDKHGNRGDTWALLSGYPETYEDGRLRSVFGSVTNISSQKWAEGIQTRKMEEAVELKRQQENFIDITSHEMRNPLSAILQCSDEISNSLTRFRQSGERNIPDELVVGCLDAAQIISLCSQHQKRIVDDILTLSKLDSALLLVTPVDAQPLTVVQRALKMHEGELQAADIQMKFIVDQSYRDLGLDWVKLDPSRVLQVLINLTTNAIKFTGTERHRVISVTISASTKRPSESKLAPVKYIPTRRKGKDVALDKDWGDGEMVFVHFSVSDTGRGLEPEEKKMLFLRFSQASPRTHVQYGGSGLGLFISRELTELQGGEIGVDSVAGKGSTFAFYVVARRSTTPEDTDGATGLKRVQPSKGEKSRSDSTNPIKQATRDLATAAHLPASGTVTTTASTPARAVVKRVLIVEDNLVNQRVLQKQLKNNGTEVHLANHGGEALEKLQQSTYWAEPVSGPRLSLGVVLMDQEMPVMDGLTCTKKIRELEREGKLTSHVPIIAVTANARPEQVQTALNAGMDDVVSKPFRIPELIPKIEDLLERYPAPEAS